MKNILFSRRVCCVNFAAVGILREINFALIGTFGEINFAEQWNNEQLALSSELKAQSSNYIITYIF